MVYSKLYLKHNIYASRHSDDRLSLHLPQFSLSNSYLCNFAGESIIDRKPDEIEPAKQRDFMPHSDNGPRIVMASNEAPSYSDSRLRLQRNSRLHRVFINYGFAYVTNIYLYVTKFISDGG